MSRARPVTAGRIEAALDRLAGFISAWDEGPALLPLYARLERELVEFRERERLMGSVLDRVSRSKDQTEGQSSAVRRVAMP